MIAVMGATGTGKTTFVNLASNSTMKVGMELHSCTDRVQVAQSFELDGRPVTLIDTPGFDDTTKSDFTILKMISDFLPKQYDEGTKLAGIIYIHRISDVRFTGMSAKNFRMFRELCGETTLKNVVIVTNRWGEVTEELGQAREAQLAGEFFKAVLEKGGRMLRNSNTLESAHDIVRAILKNQPAPLQIQTEMVDEKKDISQTAAGEELNRELQKLMKRHTIEMEELKTEMKEAARIKDEETRLELMNEARILQEQLDRVKGDTVQLRQEKEERERQIRQQQESMELRLQEQQQLFQQQMNREREEPYQQQLNREREANERQQREVQRLKEQQESYQQQLYREREESYQQQLKQEREANERQQREANEKAEIKQQAEALRKEREHALSRANWEDEVYWPFTSAGNWTTMQGMWRLTFPSI
ncbi:P-loop containing nucleoside triphosphate hydrolase protein [Flagelloscypha sp. PMI_526]|nr:P-loop containing nucleoside triphosphate hydrolase protein [Flagelloscypha sp. PMI_526]